MSKVKTITTYQPPMPPKPFLGREGDIDSIKALLATEDILLVCGPDGIGKSSLCGALAHGMLKGNELGIKYIGWLNFNESMELTLYNQLKKSKKVLSSNYQLHRNIELIKRMGASLLLIIDNYEIDSVGFDGFLEFLRGLECKCIFVSQYKSGKVPYFYVEPLSTDCIAELMALHFGADSLEKGLALEIQKALSKNTMLCEFFARGACGKQPSLAEAFDLIASSSFEPLELPKKLAEILRLFYPGKSQKIAQKLSLFSSEPVSVAVLKTVFGEDGASDIFDLADLRFFNRNYESIEMHQLLADAVRPQALASQETLSSLISKVIVATSPGAVGESNSRELFCHAVSVARWIKSSNTQKARLFTNIAYMNELMWRFAEAEEAYEKALGIIRSEHGPGHSSAVAIYHNYAMCMKQSGNYIKACQLFYKAAETCIAKYGSESILLANIYIDSIDVMVYLDESAEALDKANAAYSIYTGILGSESPQSAIALEKAGLASLSIGLVSSAGSCLEKAAGIIDRHTGKNSIAAGSIYLSYAQAMLEAGDYSLSHSYSMKALKQLKGEGRTIQAKAFYSIGKYFFSIGDYSEANAFLKRALGELWKFLPREHPENSEILKLLAYTQRNLSNEAKAQNYFKRYISIKEKAVNKNTPAQAYKNIGSVYMELGNKAQTIKYYKKALEQALNTDLAFDPMLAGAYNDLALAYMYFGDNKDSIASFHKALMIFSNAYGEDDVSCAVVFSNLALAYQNANEYENAASYYLAALRIKEGTLGKTDKNTLSAYSNLYQLYKKMGDPLNAQYYLNIYAENGGAVEIIEGELGMLD
ncbi:MAG: tetratricopeptide repeat protein [Eubacteriaceae bacterium]|nr:tetratricopeptide repeat protein [Eubacteriaceae bacterium]